MPRSCEGWPTTRATISYRTFKTDPNHPSLEFKKLPPHPDIWSVRVTLDYRAIGHRDGESIVWFFIGSHADYGAMLVRL